MSFFEKVKQFFSEHKYKCGILGVIAAVGISLYLNKYFKRRNKRQQMNPNFQRIQTTLSLQQNGYNITIKDNSKVNLKDLAKALITEIDPIIQPMQKQLDIKRGQARKQGLKEYIQVINNQIIRVSEQHVRVQNNILKSFGLSEEEYENVCFEYPEIFDLFDQLESSLRKNSKPLSLSQTKSILEVQNKYLSNKQFIQQIKQIAKQLPQETMMQAHSILSIMIKDQVKERLGYQSEDIKLSMNVYGEELSDEIEEINRLTDRITTEVIASVMPIDFMKNIEDIRNDQEYQNLPEGLKTNHKFNVMLGLMPKDLEQKQKEEDKV